MSADDPWLSRLSPVLPVHVGAVDGDWHGPDLATARRLVAESGTAGAHVTVADLVGDINPPLEAYLAEVLRELGYVVDVQQLPFTDANRSAFYDPGSPFEVVSGGWLPDYPRPSTFYDPLLRCVTPESSQAYPLGHCDASTDDGGRRRPGAADDRPGPLAGAWAEVQRTVVDQAPVVFGATLRNVWYAGPRVGNFQQSATYGPLFSQIWVQ